MPLTPNSPGQARAYAALIEQERNNIAWWRSGTRPSMKPKPDSDLVARVLANWEARGGNTYRHRPQNQQRGNKHRANHKRKAA